MSVHPASGALALGARVAERERVLQRFMDAEHDRLARAAHDLARAFARGATLIAWGPGRAATDAAHVAVEFMHPVIVGKRALPALALTNDPTRASNLGLLARGGDVALGLAHSDGTPALATWLADASARGLLTLAMVGAAPGEVRADHVFAVPSDDPIVVQEVQETAYHVLWELVHVFFEHPGLLEDACITCGDVAVEARVVGVAEGTALVEREGVRERVATELVDEPRVGERLLCHAGVALERLSPPEAPRADPDPDSASDDPTAFLYPFLEADERDLGSVMADARASTLRKGAEVVALRGSIDLDAVEACAREARERLERGGRLVAFGNGGSSTDAQDAAADCLAAGWPALALTNDPATVTAVANDVGFDNVFARQLIALGRADDVALAISTSGSSPNVLAGLEEARRRGMLTCAMVGYDGGRLRDLPWLDHLFVVPGDHIPRLQEAHATIYHLLLHAIGGRP
jgi:D-sedoheptulose 7-phosphate isomerase